MSAVILYTIHHTPGQICGLQNIL